MSSKGLRTNLLSILLLLPCILLGCGEGWDAYKDAYDQDQGGTPGEPWVGDEAVFVVLGQTEVETSLEGIQTADFRGFAAVRLSDLIQTSAITANPDAFRYDFTATDGYNLLAKRDGDKALLPDWENMHHGFLYRTGLGDLETGWEEHPWGSAVSAYNVKFMNGGEILLLEP